LRLNLKVLEHHAEYKDIGFSVAISRWVKISISLTGYNAAVGVMEATLSLQKGAIIIPLGQVRCWTNEAHSHKTFPTYITVPRLEVGDYVLKIDRSYLTDVNDFMHVVIEFLQPINETERLRSEDKIFGRQESPWVSRHAKKNEIDFSL